MATVRPFRAVRPTSELAERVAALPYDVMNSAEAREMVKDNPHSFLHVDKSEVDLPEGTDLYSDEVYAKAAANIQQMVSDGVLVKDEQPSMYIYRLVMDGREQNGLVVTSSIDDYANDVIKKHELTRAEKEEDRIRHVDTTDFHTGPIFLTYPHRAGVDVTVSDWKAAHAPVYDFTAEDGVQHTVWVIDDQAVIDALVDDFAAVPATYIADGHHRAASAVKVGMRRREAKPDWTEADEFNYFLTVLFPDDQLAIMDYNRVVTDLNGLSSEEFLAKVRSAGFEVVPATGQGPHRPTGRHEFGMLLDGEWFVLTAKPEIVDESDPIKRLDVSILQERVLAPILGIGDPRTDKRIDFVGGIRGLEELEKRCREDMKVAFALNPTSMQDLFDIADSGNIMPPKSTWFEPKMRSGLFLHSLSEA